jgi:hypothetical protein
MTQSSSTAGAQGQAAAAAASEIRQYNRSKRADDAAQPSYQQQVTILEDAAQSSAQLKQGVHELAAALPVYRSIHTAV